MNQVQATSERIGKEVGLDPTLLAGLIVALIQTVVSCIRDNRSSSNSNKIVTPRNIVDWLDARDVPFGTGWLIARYRRMRLVRQVEYYCVASTKIPNQKIDQIKTVLLREVSTLTYKKMEELYINSGVI